MKLLPIDSIVLTYGFGAEPVRAVILAPQRADGTYSVGREGDTSATSRISQDDIVDVIDETPKMNTPSEVKVKLGLRVKFLKPVTVAGRFEIPAGEVVRVTRVIGSNAAWVVANDGTTWAEISIGKGSCVWIREDDSEGGVWWIDSPEDLADEVSESDARTECARLEGINSELLKALQAIEAILDGRQPIDVPGAVMVARAAIAKATNA